MSSDATGDLDDRQNAVLLKAMTEADFRTKLMDDPRAALSQENLDIPADVTIKVIEVSQSEMLFPLPPFIGDQLSADELAAVSGGLTHEEFHRLTGNQFRHVIRKRERERRSADGSRIDGQVGGL